MTPVWTRTWRVSGRGVLGYGGGTASPVPEWNCWKLTLVQAPLFWGRWQLSIRWWLGGTRIGTQPVAGRLLGVRSLAGRWVRRWMVLGWEWMPGMAAPAGWAKTSGWWAGNACCIGVAFCGVDVGPCGLFSYPGAMAGGWALWSFFLPSYPGAMAGGWALWSFFLPSYPGAMAGVGGAEMRLSGPAGVLFRRCTRSGVVQQRGLEGRRRRLRVSGEDTAGMVPPAGSGG